MAAGIVQHGCNKCGSCPVGYPGSNDSKLGELTFDHVQNGNKCAKDTVCPQSRDTTTPKEDFSEVTSVDRGFEWYGY